MTMVTLEFEVDTELWEAFCKICEENGVTPEEAIVRYRERYHPVGVFECRPFDGVAETVEAFRRAGEIQVVSSSKPENMCRKILGKFRMDQWFDEIVGASEDGRIDSKAEVLAEAFRRMRERDPEFSAEDVVLIGDTRFDADGAAQMGIDCLGVSYGFGTRNELLEHGAICVFDSLKELKNAILEPLGESSV